MRTLKSMLRLALFTAWALPMAAVAIPSAKRYANDEFGMAMTFPAASRVCPALSGDHPHGFYAHFHGMAQTCDDMRNGSVPREVSVISIYAAYNASEARSARSELNDDCGKPGFRQAISAAALRRLAIPHHVAVKCATKSADGRIDIDLAVADGQMPDSPAGTPFIFYHVAFSTSPGHLRQDLPVFEHFLASLRINPPRPVR